MFDKDSDAEFSPGMHLVPIPAKWAEALERIQQIFPGALICGGALRDHLLGRKVADLDIFIHGTDADVLETGATAWWPDWKMRHNKVELQNYELNFTDVVGVLERTCFEDYLDKPPRVQLIVLQSDPDLSKVAGRCDFGICRIGHTGKVWMLDHEFIHDVYNKTFTLHRCTIPMNHLKRWWRLHKKYPDYSLKDPHGHLTEVIKSYGVPDDDDDPFSLPVGS
jgi:hypothetical protein